MKPWVLTILLAGLLWTQAPRTSAQAAVTPTQQCALLVHVTGFRNQKGVAGGTVFNSPDGWPENNAKAYHHEHVAIVDRKATLPFTLPPGKYAVAVLHDENENQKMDRNWLGIPKEGFGFANNPHVGLKAPPYDKATVLVTCPVTEISIQLIYK